MNGAATAAGTIAGAPKKRAPLVTEFKGNSLDDGPGVRAVVFFKGCPLDCAWCHNPETKAPGPALRFDSGKCIGAHDCTRICERKALDPARAGFVDRDACNLCMRCTEVCGAGALSVVGREWTLDELMREIVRYAPFYRTSGGGVTVSGGEATLHGEFCGALLQRVKQIGIHTLLETCGQFNLARYREQMEPWVDEVYFDLKVMDDADHRRFCGAPNRAIHENFRALLRSASEGGPRLLPRIPLIPGITTTDENLVAAAEFLRSTGATQVELLAYNPLWHDKAASIAADVRYVRDEWMSREEIDRCRAHFADFELLGDA